MASCVTLSRSGAQPLKGSKSHARFGIIFGFHVGVKAALRHLRREGAVLADDHRQRGRVLVVARRLARSTWVVVELVDDVVVRDRRRGRRVELEIGRVPVSLHADEVVGNAELVLLGPNRPDRVVHGGGDRVVRPRVAAGFVGEPEDDEAILRERVDQGGVHCVGPGGEHVRVRSRLRVRRDARRLGVARVAEDHRLIAAEREKDVDAGILSDGLDDVRDRRLVLRGIGEPAHFRKAVHRQRVADEARLPARDETHDLGLLHHVGTLVGQRAVVSAQEDVIDVHAAAHPLRAGAPHRHHDLVAVGVEPAGGESAVRSRYGGVRRRRGHLRAAVAGRDAAVVALGPHPSAVVWIRGGPRVQPFGLRRLAGAAVAGGRARRRTAARNAENAAARGERERRESMTPRRRWTQDESILHRSSPIRWGLGATCTLERRGAPLPAPE